MSGTSFPDIFLLVTIWAHIAFGGVAAFIICPVAVFAQKGSNLHRNAGHWYLITVSLICTSGVLALVDPAFLSEYWQQESAAKGFSAIFQSSQNPVLFFLFLVVMLAYMSFSAVRLWPRIGYGAADRIDSSFIDWILAVTMGVYSIFFLLVGIEDFLNHINYAATFIVGAIIMLGFVTFDVYTFVLRPEVKRYPWWALHMSKLFYAWAGLLDAFWIRLVPAGTLPITLPFGTTLWLSFAIAALFLYKGVHR